MFCFFSCVLGIGAPSGTLAFLLTAAVVSPCARAVGRVTLALALTGALCGLALMLQWSDVGAVCDGRVEQPLTFLIVDSGAGVAISGARVRIRDLQHTGVEVPTEAVLEAEGGADGVSDSEGLVTLTYRFPFSAHRRAARTKETVCFPSSLWLEVTARGYERKLGLMSEYVGMGRRLDDFPLPPIRVALSRK